MSDPETTLEERTALARREATTRTLLGVAGTTTVIGLALAVAGDQSVSRWLTLGGLLGLIVGLHRYGRLGSAGSLPDRHA